MEANVFKPQGTDLASRHTAADLRRHIEQSIAAGHPVVVDLRHVLSISESYADELFGVLIAARGLQWFGAWVQVLANRDTLVSIAGAVRERVPDSGRSEFASTIQTLLAAKRAGRLRVTA